MILCNFPNPPKRAGDDVLDPSATVRAAVEQFPGFPVYVFHNPDQFGSANEGMGYPYDLSGPEWKAAYAECKGAQLWPRIGGCEPNDLPPSDGSIDTLMKRLRPSKVFIADFGSATEAAVPSARYQKAAHANSMVYAPEANAAQHAITPGEDTWIVAEWFLWDVPTPGAVSGWNPRRWRIRDLLSLSPRTKVIVEVTSETRKKQGFVNGAGDWPAAKVRIARAFHEIDPQRVLVSTRMLGMSALQVAELRGLNG